MLKNCFIDLDGTLLNQKKEITKDNKEAVKKALEQNKKIYIATGRPLEGVYPIIEELGLVKDNDYFIAYNGAIVYESKTKKRVKEEFLTGKELREIYKFAEEQNANIHAFLKDGTLISPKVNEFTEIESRLSQLNLKIIDFNTINDEEEIIKILIVGKKEKLDDVEKQIPKNIKENFEVMRSANIFLEFLSKKANKGYAMEWILKQTNSLLDETMAIGDGGNDCKMIELAKIGVAMQNAYQYVKDVSDYVTDDLENSGVAKAICKFLIN